MEGGGNVYEVVPYPELDVEQVQRGHQSGPVVVAARIGDCYRKRGWWWWCVRWRFGLMGGGAGVGYLRGSLGVGREGGGEGGRARRERWWPGTPLRPGAQLRAPCGPHWAPRRRRYRLHWRLGRRGIKMRRIHQRKRTRCYSQNLGLFLPPTRHTKSFD